MNNFQVKLIPGSLHIDKTCQCARADPVAVLARLGGREDVAGRALRAVAALDAGHATALARQLIALEIDDSEVKHHQKHFN